MSVDEYTQEFEKLLIKCDINEHEEQTSVRCLGGLKPKYANVVELQQYTTFDEVRKTLTNVTILSPQAGTNP